MIVAFIMWSVCAAVFVGLAVYCRCAKKAVGFWTSEKAPEVSDVKGYNRAVSNLWIVYAVLFEALGVPFLFAKQNSPVYIISVLGTVFISIGVMAAYHFIAEKYKKQDS